MNVTPFARHQGLVAFSIAVVVTALLLSLINGQPKIAAEIAWLDVLGEGSVALLTLGWIVTALASRPPGKVTRWLVIGLNCFLFSACLDLLDEFSRYESGALWLSMVESIPAGIGMVVMSIALYWWHQEQLALNRQLQRREWHHRSHEQIDPITQLYRADYWQSRAQECQQLAIETSIVMMDINNFSDFNRRFGQQEGDRFLREIAQLVVMHCRPHDLACRYAGDRFVLLLPHITSDETQQLTEHLSQSVRHFAFRCDSQATAIFNSVRLVGAPLQAEEPVENLLSRLNRQLDESAAQQVA